jgi:hypothetical protein
MARKSKRGEFNTSYKISDQKEPNKSEKIFMRIYLMLLLFITTSAEAYVPLVKTIKTNLINPSDLTMDAQNQLIFISNMNGGKNRKNNCGFISRLKISNNEDSNEVIIKGGDEGIILDAPKGILYDQNKLYVADIDTVRIFKRSRNGWISEKNIPIRGAKYLNKIAKDEQGNLWISDTGQRTIIRLSPPYQKNYPRRYFYNKIPTPTGICIDKVNPDILWITSNTTSLIYKASLSTNKILKTFQTRALSLGSLTPIDENKIASTNQEDGKVLCFTLSNQVVIRSPINKKSLHEPGGVLWDFINKVYLVTDTDLGEIRIYQKQIKPTK